MQLIPVSFEELSDIKYTVALTPHAPYATPEFLVVTFTGVYRDGSAGNTDATFMVAIMEGVQRAWFTKSLIIDLSGLTYWWGDEMSWIYRVGHFQPSPCYKPLAIIVGDNCRDALQTLDPEQYNQHCVQSFEEALTLIRSEKPKFDKCMDEWRNR
ncbi:MAG: hypothetical protein AAGF95_24010 [Chloroflexota bacterium]